MQRIIFIDPTSAHTHLSIKNRGIGASEYQFYNLIKKMSEYFKVKCYFYGKEAKVVEGIEYYSLYDNLINAQINSEDIFIVQRFLPDIQGEIYKKIKNNKIFIWNHDLIDKSNFIWAMTDEEKNKCVDEQYFKTNVLSEYFNNKNINYVFVSKTIKQDFKNYTAKFNFTFESERSHHIYNILYEDEFLEVKNTNIVFNPYLLTFASALHKGIEKVIAIFDKLITVDKNFILQIMSPGYELDKWADYLTNLKNKYKDNIIIVGSTNKNEYSKNIKKSLCVLTGIFYETFGCVFAESYYLGTPVICDRRSGAVKEIIDNNYIVNYDNVDETIKKILELKNNRDNIKINLNDKFLLEHNFSKWLKKINISIYDIHTRIIIFYKSWYNYFNNQIINLREYLENKDILDIGSNIGLISLGICENMKYKSIHLFEPNTYYLNYSKNLLKKYKNLYFNNYGVGNKSEIKKLYCNKNINIGWNTFLEKDPLQNDNFINYMDAYECQIIKLDDYYQNIENIDFIKIDVEGYEGFVIEGALKLIEKFKPHIYVEIGWGTNHPNWNYNQVIYNKLFDIGYKRITFSEKTEDVLFTPL